MIEIPETYVLSDQINNAVKNKIITNVTANARPHNFAWFTGDPSEYHNMLTGKKIIKANPGTGYTCGGNTEILCGDMLLVISTPIRYHCAGDNVPARHQLAIEFDDFSHLSCTVQMWGAMYCFKINEKGELDGNHACNKKPNPLEKEFNGEYFEGLLKEIKPNTSVKAFLATEQRIPGLGNGVLQDILFNAKINPKTKMGYLKDKGLQTLYDSVKNTLNQMYLYGGRNTEKDLFGNEGGYKTLLSCKTIKKPCPVCGTGISRETYMGGNIYYCPECQVLKN